MRTLNRNKQELWYANYVSKAEVVDDYGYKTGEHTITYSSPRRVEWSISSVSSDVEVQMFGVEAKNTVRIVAEKQGFDLTETSILWIGKTPHSPYDPTNPDHNYVIVGFRPSLNEMVFYAKRVY